MLVKLRYYDDEHYRKAGEAIKSFIFKTMFE